MNEYGKHWRSMQRDNIRAPDVVTTVDGYIHHVKELRGEVREQPRFIS